MQNSTLDFRLSHPYPAVTIMVEWALTIHYLSILALERPSDSACQNSWKMQPSTTAWRMTPPPNDGCCSCKRTWRPRLCRPRGECPCMPNDSRAPSMCPCLPCAWVVMPWEVWSEAGGQSPADLWNNVSCVIWGGGGCSEKEKSKMREGDRGKGC